MNTQMLTSKVVFRQPFVLSGLDGIQPAGTYKIETYSELLDIPTAVAYRRLSTSIELHSQPAGIIRQATIDPAELEEALRLDAALEPLPTVVAPMRAKHGSLQSTSMESPVASPKQAKPPASGHNAVEWHRYTANGIGKRRSLWRQWVSLNANELTWVGLIVGGLLILSIGR
jgi:hypothetical protein